LIATVAVMVAVALGNFALRGISHMHSDTVTMPAHWASAIVNGDYSGLTLEESFHLDSMLDALEAEGLSVVGVADDEPRFTWSYRTHDPMAECHGGEVMDYVVVQH